MELTYVKTLLEYGTTPALLLIAFLLVHLKTSFGKSVKDLGEKLSAVQAEMGQLERRIEEKIKEESRYREELEARIGCVERDYLQRDDFYRDSSGWRAEINRLCDKIDQFILGFGGKAK